MFKKQLNRFALVAALVTTLGVIAPAVGQAAGPGGTGPNDAMAPTGSMEHLNVGQSRWYAVTSAGKDKNGDPSHVLITLYSQPQDSAGFNIWTAERLNERAASSDPNKEAPPVGVGSKVQMTTSEGAVTKDLFPHAVVWAGGFNQRQSFLVEVYQTGSQASDYLLSITGDAVTFPTSVTSSTSSPSAPSAGLAMPAASASGGTGPNNATAPSPNWQHLNIGQSRWYAFTSEGKDKNGDPSHVLITLYSQPQNSAGFNIWTAERLNERAASSDPNKDAPPVGVGAPVEITRGDNTRVLFNHALVWAGGFEVKTTFLVEVYQTGSQASDYLLSITGDAVTFPASVTSQQPSQPASAITLAMPAASAGGTGPSNAIAPTGKMEHLNVGQSRWYAFGSAGKDQNGDPSHVLITLYAQPDNSAGFNIWTAERLNERAASTNPNKDAPPVGTGSKVTITRNDNTRELFNGALVWAGGFETPAKFLVEVYQTGSQASDYTLTVNGDALSFP
jgi:hypothetical protein